MTLGDGNKYDLRLIYRDAADGLSQDAGWTLDISDAFDGPLIMGVPMITGADLLAQYAYIGIPGKLWIGTDGDPAAPPTFDDLGTTSNLYYEL